MMSIVAILLQPVFAAIIGWCTVWILVYLLFHPQKPSNLFGLSIQGFFPARHAMIANRIGHVVGTELFNIEQIGVQINDPSHFKTLLPGIEAHIDEFLQKRLTEKLPVLAMFLSAEILGTIKTSLMEEIEAMLPQVINQLVGNISSKLDIQQIVTRRLLDYSSDQFERLFSSGLQKEIIRMKLLGGLVGFSIGLVQMAVSLWISN